jgi:RNA polymerase sigma factor (sigma-70 family)
MTARGDLRDAPEAAVVALAASGDELAFTELVRRRQASMRALMRHLSRDAALADDLAQVVFVEMWKSLRRLKATNAFGAWLRQIGVNVWLQHARKKDPSLHRVTEPATELPIDADDRASPGTRLDLATGLALLPGAVRLCIVLAHQEGLSHGDIATLTGIPLGTVKSHIARGSARLRELLKDYGSAS